LRKLRLLAVAVIAVFGLSAVAFAQTSGNTYSVHAKVNVKGGSKKKPKPGGFDIGFQIGDAAGNVPQVVKTYFIGAQGLKVNTKVATKTCTVKTMDQAQSDSKCSKSALIGKGEINNYVSNAGAPAAGATTCRLPVKIYNAGRNKAAIWIKTGPPDCIAAVAQAIDAKWVSKGGYTGLQFTVPDGLRHQLGLDLSVFKVDTKFAKKTRTIKVRGKKHTVGYFESVGCGKSKHRKVRATFTDETNRTVTANETLKSC
jgi:hypothetical protein